MIMRIPRTHCCPHAIQKGVILNGDARQRASILTVDKMKIRETIELAERRSALTAGASLHLQALSWKLSVKISVDTPLTLSVQNT